MKTIWTHRSPICAKSRINWIPIALFWGEGKGSQASDMLPSIWSANAPNRMTSKKLELQSSVMWTLAKVLYWVFSLTESSITVEDWPDSDSSDINTKWSPVWINCTFKWFKKIIYCILKGRTSSVGNDILGFDSRGNVVNKPDAHGGHLDWVKICEAASKVITFIDLAGHERYLKTTIFGKSFPHFDHNIINSCFKGMTGHAPDYTMLMVGANAGIVGMTKEVLKQNWIISLKFWFVLKHLGLALALNVPVFVVVTKIDMCPQNVLQNTLKLLQRVLKSPGCRKIPVMVQSEDDVVIAATNFATERLCPIFQVSNVNGSNLHLLRLFLNLLMPRTTNHDNEAAEFQIDDTYSVPVIESFFSIILY